jgi:hypothetical protein
MGQGGIKSGKYCVTEIPNAVFTAERKAVNTEISLAVFTEILLCCSTAVPRYRVTYLPRYGDTAILLTGRDGTAHDYHTCQF